MDSKRYFSPSNALKTNSIYFLDRKIINVCSDKSKIQTSGRAAPKNSVLEVFLERKTAKKSDFWTFSSKWTSTCCRPTGWFGKISRNADSNVKCKHPNCPKGLLCRDLTKSLCVCPSVRPSVRPSAPFLITFRAAKMEPSKGFDQKRRPKQGPECQKCNALDLRSEGK